MSNIFYSFKVFIQNVEVQMTCPVIKPTINEKQLVPEPTFR